MANYWMPDRLQNYTIYLMYGLSSERGASLNNCLAEGMGQHVDTGRVILRLNPEEQVSEWKKLKIENLQDYKVLQEEHFQAHFKKSSALLFWDVLSCPVGSAWLPSKDDLFSELLKILETLSLQRAVCQFQFPCDIRSMGIFDFLRDRCHVLLFHFNRTPLRKFLMKMDAFEKRMNALLRTDACLPQLQRQFASIQCSLRIAFVFEKRLPFVAPSSQSQRSPSILVPTHGQDMPSLFEDVDHHGEPAAARDPLLLEEQAQQEWIERVDELIQSSFSKLESSQEPERVFLYPYTRAPREFLDALMIGPELKPIREKMIASNCPYVLEGSAAKVFVPPEHYSTVMKYVSTLGEPLRASHVIVAESLLPCVEAAVSSIPSLRNVRVKETSIKEIGAIPEQAQNADMMDKHDDEAQDWDYALDVQRTFICYVPELLDAQSVTQSTTEVHGGGVNPRRKVVRAALPSI